MTLTPDPGPDPDPEPDPVSGWTTQLIQAKTKDPRADFFSHFTQIEPQEIKCEFHTWNKGLINSPGCTLLYPFKKTCLVYPDTDCIAHLRRLAAISRQMLGMYAEAKRPAEGQQGQGGSPAVAGPSGHQVQLRLGGSGLGPGGDAAEGNGGAVQKRKLEELGGTEMGFGEAKVPKKEEGSIGGVKTEEGTRS